jgi:hypothetical protein
MEQDGETEITFGIDGEVNPSGQPAFEGSIDTPSRRVALLAVPLKHLLAVPVESTRTRVRVWTNHTTEPDRVRIGLSASG